MTEYQAKSTRSLSYDVTKDDKVVGKLSYKSWFKSHALIKIANNSTYQVVRKGFWGTTIELKDGETLLLNFKMNWNEQIVVQTYFNDLEKNYIFKQRGLFNGTFILTEKEGIELLVIKPNLKWKKMNYEFQITVSDTFETFPNKEILLMNSLLCANYYLSMAAGM